ncbi:MAG: MIP family channel protein [Dehalococcoidia bacterium]
MIGRDEINQTETWQAAAAEFAATFAFVFLGPAAVVASFIAIDPGTTGLTPARLAVIAMGHGFAIAVLVWATAHISGGHINPAVTIAAFVTGKIKAAKGLMYVAAQMTGGICGAFLLKAVIPNAQEGGLGAHALSPAMSDETAGLALLVEAVLTFFLVFVIFAVAMDRRGPGNVAPFAIGMVIMLDHFIGVPLTGASMNPARTFGPAWAADQWADHWIYWAGPIAGGVIAAVIYEAIFAKRGEEASESG